MMFVRKIFPEQIRGEGGVIIWSLKGVWNALLLNCCLLCVMLLCHNFPISKLRKRSNKFQLPNFCGSKNRTKWTFEPDPDVVWYNILLLITQYTGRVMKLNIPAPIVVFLFHLLSSHWHEKVKSTSFSDKRFLKGHGQTVKWPKPDEVFPTSQKRDLSIAVKGITRSQFASSIVRNGILCTFSGSCSIWPL